MNLIKKILGMVFIILGILICGVIICAGVLIVFPNTKIFGYSYLNTTKIANELDFVENLNNLSTKNGESYTFVVESGNFDIKVLTYSEGTDQVKVELDNKVIGFTNSMDSNKKARVLVNYDDTSKTCTMKVFEPNGLFLKRDTTLKVYLPKNFYKNNQITFNTTTKNGTAIFGDKNEANSIILQNVTCECENIKGSVDFQNVDVKGDVKIKNILGQIRVDKNLSGNVIIDSTIGTYYFKNIANLTVLAGEDGKVNNPAITVENCNNLTYKAQSGLLNVKGIVNGKIDITTNNAEINIDTFLKGQFYIKADNGKVNIKNLGYLNADAGLSSWNISQPATIDVDKRQIVVKAGRVNIVKCLLPTLINLETASLNIENAYRGVGVNSTTGSIRVNYVAHENGEDAVANYINNTLLPILQTETLEVVSDSGNIQLNNIQSKVDVQGRVSSQITLDFEMVIAGSKVETKVKAVIVKVPLGNYDVQVKMLKTSNAKIDIDVASTKIDKYPLEMDEEKGIIINEQGDYKLFNFKVNSGSAEIEPELTIQNTNGSIIIKQK